MSTYIRVCVCVFVCVCMYYVCMYMYYVCICMYMYYVCICMYVYVCMYVCMHVHSTFVSNQKKPCLHSVVYNHLFFSLHGSLIQQTVILDTPLPEC